MSGDGLKLLPQEPDRFADLRALDAPQQPQPPKLGDDGPMILETDSQGPPDRFGDLRAIDDRRRQQAEKVAIETFDLAAQHDPKIRGEAQQIAREIGVDVDSATRSIDVFREQARRKAVQDRRLMAENPVLARQLQNIEFAAVARRDLDNLTAFEQFSNAWQRGALQVERGRIGERMRRFGEGEQDIKRLAQIGRRLQEIPEPDSLLTGAAEVLGQMGSTLPLAARDASIYGTAAAGAAALVGQAGPQVALPEEVLTVPAAFVTGATFGGAMSMARQTFEIESGNAFLDMTRSVEEGGLGLDRQRASNAALGVGVANMLFEMAGAGFATKAARIAITRELTHSVAEALAKPTMAKAAGKFALDYAEGVGGEVLTEVLQEMSSIIGEEAAGAQGDRAKTIARLGEIIAKTTQGMALLGVPGPAMVLRQNMQDVREAEHAQQLFLALAKNATDSQTRANNPAAYEAHVTDEIAANAPAAATTYVDAQQFAAVLAQAEKAAAGGASPTAQLRQAMPDVMERADDAIAQGGDVEIPTGKYAAHVAPTEIGKALLPHVRFSPDGISLAEAEAIGETASDDAAKSLDQEQKDAEAWLAEAQQVQQALYNQLVATGRMQKREAARLAAFWRAAVEVQAERVGETPASFAKKYPLAAAVGETGEGLAQFAGQQAKGAPRAALQKALEMQQQGAKPADIHAATGWAVGPTGNWRFEISDNDAKLKSGEGGKLADWLDHPKLFKAYPKLAAIPTREVEMNLTSREAGAYEQAHQTSLARKQYPGYIQLRTGLTPEKRLSVLLHEVQHAIQDLEGVDLVAFDAGQYRERGVEVEARNTQKRQHMNKATRDATLPESTEDVARADQFRPATLLYKQARGSFNPATFRVSLTKDSDASTFLHEMGHAFLTILADLARQKAHPQVVDDFAAFLKWAGVDSAEAWHAMSLDQQRKAHENFAANFEDYLFTGEAPTPGLKKLFQRLTEFLRRVYRAIRDQLNAAHREQFGEDLLPLSPEIRGVMDRMLAADDQVRVTQAIRGAVPTFQTQEESGMNDEQWQAYQAQQRAADDEAVDELTRASVRDMRWLRIAKAGKLREIQEKAKRVREGVRQDVAKEVQQRPVYRVQRWLQTGEIVNPDGTKTNAEGEHKLNRQSVGELLAPGVPEADLLATELLPDESTRSLAALPPEKQMAALRKFLKVDGLNPDEVALSFEFETGRGMLDAILAAPPVEDAIEATTDARMLREHAEVADPRKVQERIERALHNETRRRFVATELRALGRSQEPMRVTLAAAKMAAEAALGKKRVRDLSNRQAFTLAARRASKEAQEALGKSGGQGPEATLAYQAKRRQLVQEFMADLAHDARDEVKRALAQFDKFDVKDKDAAKSRDVDLVHVGRALAAAYGLGAPAQTQQEKEQQAAGLAKLQAEHPDLFARVQPLLAAASRGAIDYRNLTLNEFREVGAVAEWLWDQARANKLLDAEGKKVEKEKAVDDLLGGIGALPPRTPGTPGETPSPGHRDMLPAWSSFASLKRAEHWARWMDRGKDNGPFQRFFIAPIQRAVQAYRTAQRDSVARYAARLERLQEASGSLWHARIEAAEIGFTFKGKKELIGALLHIGNESNLQRLLLNRFGRDGRAWGEIREDGTFDASRWDAFIRRAFDAGLITKADIQFIRETWADYAKLLPQAQKAHKAMLGFEFTTVPLRSVSTPWGDIEGGYAPAIADPDEMPPRADLDAEAGIEGVTKDGLFSLPTNKGFTLNRSDNPNTGRPLALDLGKQLAAFDQELRFIHLMPAVRDALRIIRDQRFKTALGAYDREAIPKILLPYLNNVARQTTVRSSGDRFIDSVVSFLRNASSVAALGWNLINAAVQATGLSNSLTQVRGRFMLDGVRHWASSPARAWQEATDRSPFMAQRFDRTTRALRDRIANAVDDGMLAGVRATQRTIGRWAFILQYGVQSAVDLSTWHGAYAQAIGEGKSDADAVEFADGAVRRSQGSQNPEDAAAYESNVVGRILGQFGSYSNLVLNTLLHAQGKGGAILWALLVPAIAEGIIRTALLGGPDDHDKDEDDTIEEWAKVFGKNAVRNVAGLIPGGSMLASMAESEGSRVQVPLMSAGSQIVRGAIELVEAASGDKTSEAEANAIAAFVSMATRVPVAAPVRYAQQLAR